MIAHKKEFFGGFIMMAIFISVLIAIFIPLFDKQDGTKQNALEYLDDLYNSISKGSAYYIPAVKEHADAYIGSEVEVTLAMADSAQADQTLKLYETAGCNVTASDNELKVSGDLGKIMAATLVDADSMYHNKGEEIKGRYGYDERQVVYNWWKSFKAMDKDLKAQKKFEEAKMLSEVVKKAVETSYNYYTIEPQKITEKLGIVLFSLVFYVAYTLFYGFSIMFMFEGWGLKLSH
ncbi:MAG: hypothetical protein U9O82_01905 [Thermodesulfobacteriota bacterium]|nr:hypothetical protein [Thermodesulfobacteriota bacterium]